MAAKCDRPRAAADIVFRERINQCGHRIAEGLYRLVRKGLLGFAVPIAFVNPPLKDLITVPILLVDR
jgi:hypothetical protein